MKQRAVIRLEAGNRKKNYTKAMEIAVRVPGVETVSLQGDEKNQLTVIGDGIDAVSLTSLLRKKLGLAELISLVPCNNLGMENWENLNNACRTTVQPIDFPQQSYQSSYYVPPYYIHHDVGMNHHQDSCVIL